MTAETETPGTEIAPSGASDPTSTELAAIERTMKERPAEYYRDETLPTRYRELVAQRDNLPAPVKLTTPDQGRALLPPEVVAELDANGQFDANYRRAQLAAANVVAWIGDEPLAREFVASYNTLPSEIRSSVFAELARGAPTFAKPATKSQIEAFRATPVGASFVKTWGAQAPRKLGTIAARFQRIEGALSEPDRRALNYFFDNITPQEQAAALQALVVA